ncbi:MAG: nucleotidyltransferase family protein [Hyphomicrobiaceae bacterium]
MSFPVKTAMILGAGLGTRMRPLTNQLPKPLVPLAGKPLIDHVLDRLAGAGVELAVVNVHYRADQLIEHLKARKSPRIVISDEREGLLDTGGGVKRALPLIGKGPFYIHNSDAVSIGGLGANLRRMAEIWNPERMDSLMLLATATNSVGYSGMGDFEMTPDGILRRRKERQVAPFIFSGVSIATPRLFLHSPEGAFSLNVLWDRAMAEGRLHGMQQEGIWMHVGDPQSLAEAERTIGVGALHA